MSWKIGDLCVAKSREFGWTNSQIEDINKDVASVQFIQYQIGDDIHISNLKQFGPFAVNKKGELIEDQAAKEDYSGWKVRFTRHENRTIIAILRLEMRVWLSGLEMALGTMPRFCISSTRMRF